MTIPAFFISLYLDKCKKFIRMNEETQAEFIEWLSEQLKVASPEELQAKLEDMGEEGIKKAFEMFSKQKTQDNTAVAMAKDGAKLDYIKKLKKFQSGGMLASNNRPVAPKLPAAPAIPVPVPPKDYYQYVEHSNQKLKVPLNPEEVANIREINGKSYNWNALQGLDYDFQAKKYNVQPDWFNKILKEKGAVGVGHTDINSYADWINQGPMGAAPKEVFPLVQQATVVPAQGQGQFITSQSGGAAGWQGSAQNTKAVENKERALKAQSSYYR